MRHVLSFAVLAALGLPALAGGDKKEDDTPKAAKTRKLLKAVEEFESSIERNQSCIPNYGERYRHGERISTGFVESAVNKW